jgi:hypothetical protein
MLLSTLVVSLPANVLALAREQGASPWAFAESIAPWFARFAAIATGATVLVVHGSAAGPRGARCRWCSRSVPAYLAVMMPVLRTPPLGPMLHARLQPWLPRMPVWSAASPSNRWSRRHETEHRLRAGAPPGRREPRHQPRCRRRRRPRS